jgi:hypothetical protein
MPKIIMTLEDVINSTGGKETNLHFTRDDEPGAPHVEFASDAVVASIAIARLWNGGAFDTVVEEVCPDIMALRDNADFMAGLLEIEEVDTDASPDAPVN